MPVYIEKRKEGFRVRNGTRIPEVLQMDVIIARTVDSAGSPALLVTATSRNGAYEDSIYRPRG